MVDDDRSRLPLRIGISACLRGQQVCFDSGHKRDAFLTETFGRLVEWMPVCPEVECGLGTPREAMRLLRAERGPRLVTMKTARDLTASMERFARPRVAALAAEDLSGYILKKDSPSCGLERVKVYERHGAPTRDGRGLFAAVHFHSAHKLMVLAYAPEVYRRRYTTAFMQALAQLATPRRHTNVLQHMAGYFKNRLDAASTRELGEVIDDYRRGLVPLIVPLTLVRHHVRIHDVRYLAGQIYLEPHPKELMLRNHV
jgi:uncharacterized protein YbbK (DUF523 family)